MQDQSARIAALERIVERYTVLVETSSAIVACTELDEALSAITRVLVERLDVAWANVYDYRAQEREFEVMAFYQIPGLGIVSDEWIGTRFDITDNSTWVTALQEARPVVWYSDAPSPWTQEVALRKSWGELTSITVPLVYRDRTLGMLDVGESRLLRRFDKHDVRVAQAIADHAAIAIDNARTRAELEEQATTDGLTGLHNHRHLHQRLVQEVMGAVRYRRPLSALMIDIDDFKRFNDTYGHPQGDKLLAELAELLRQVTRKDVDIVARYGGEEFAVLLPETPADERGAIAVAERLRELVAGRTFEGKRGRREARITVSVGVAGLGDTDCPPSAILGCADEALYEAKHAGKNVVCRYRAQQSS